MSIFKKDEKFKIEKLEDPWQSPAREKLYKASEGGALDRISRAGEAYGEPLVAGMSDVEREGQATLEDYMDSAMASETTLGRLGAGEVQKTLEGEYDPATSPYYASYKDTMLRDLEEAADRINAQGAGRDQFYGGGRLDTIGETEEAGFGSLAQMLGTLFENERARKFSAAPMAMEFANAQVNEPLQRVAASQQYGALPRMLEQAGLSADYSEYQRQLGDLGLALDVAMGLSQYKPQYTGMMTGGGDKDWVSDTKGFISLGSSIGGMMAGMPPVGGINTGGNPPPTTFSPASQPAPSGWMGSDFQQKQMNDWLTM